jgi:hypothetical protein
MLASSSPHRMIGMAMIQENICQEESVAEFERGDVFGA